MDLKAHLEELRQAATAKRQLTPEEIRERAQKAAAAAARGRAFGVDRSEETRLRTFDKHEAEVVGSDVVTSWVTAGIALVIGIGAIALASNQLNAAGGAEGLKVLSMAQLREWGFGVMIQPPVLVLTGTGLAIGGLLCAIGQAWRAVLGQKSVAAVARGEKPLVIGTHPTTRAGLILGAIACPPLGVLVGLIMRLGAKNEDTKAMGGQLFLIGLAILVILGLNMIAGLAANIKSPPTPPTGKETAGVGVLRQAAQWITKAC
jgi:hypothetical protein